MYRSTIFSILSHKGHEFQNFFFYVFWFSIQNFSKTFLILRTLERDMMINVYRSSLISIRCSCQIFTKREFCRRFLGKYSHKNFTKIRLMGVELIHADRWADRQTDVTKLIAAFRTFASAPKKQFHNSVFWSFSQQAGHDITRTCILFYPYFHCPFTTARQST